MHFDRIKEVNELLFGIFAVGVMVGLGIAAPIMLSAINQVKTNAVENGVAYYKIVDNKGNTEFKWITE